MSCHHLERALLRFEPGQEKEELRDGEGRSLLTPFEHPDTAIPETLISVVFSIITYYILSLFLFKLD